MYENDAAPKASVVIPTYNRAGLLRDTLRQLTRQTVPAGDFEVIVSDDGSSDETADVVREFTDRLRIRYCFQEDRGARIALARNQGARLAAGRILVFLDTGAMVGPDFLRSHLAVHDGPGPRAVIGYAFGYNPSDPMHQLAGPLDLSEPEAVWERFRDDPAFRDIRHEQFTGCDFDLSRRRTPWSMLFTINFSVDRAAFWAIDGFDEHISGWGGEDLELGYRLYRDGVAFHSTYDGWVIESSHERNMDVSFNEFISNMAQILAKHPQPAMELGWALVGWTRPFWDWEKEYRAFEAWTAEVDGVSVAGELAASLGEVRAGGRIAVFGSGGDIPSDLPPSVLVEFDRGLLDAALADGVHEGHHCIGLRTPLADGAVDTVVITSRLSGLWKRWGDDLTAEAGRVGRRVINLAG
ncbi:glycosyltransferase [Streptomyces drozdowiczii]|uniref:Glycosyltransferase n=1 Tax=Streptomyces drozdowiczii TaxID=202862 RepID=A0ABY6Q1V9_9ACTN|nr:glycosyltransferase [Streptomyces drozdowiczii]MCX0241780.1 glycosyltransferase [Streptomyces drozdowiczii]UZK58009.1 glycosyltransferase [Streptomyces drozdowiczii]